MNYLQEAFRKQLAAGACAYDAGTARAMAHEYRGENTTTGNGIINKQRHNRE